MFDLLDRLVRAHGRHALPTLPSAAQHLLYETLPARIDAYGQMTGRGGTPEAQLLALAEGGMCPTLQRRIASDDRPGYLELLALADHELDAVDLPDLLGGLADDRAVQLTVALLAHPRRRVRTAALDRLAPHALTASAHPDVTALACAASHHDTFPAVLARLDADTLTATLAELDGEPIAAEVLVAVLDTIESRTLFGHGAFATLPAPHQAALAQLHRRGCRAREHRHGRLAGHPLIAASERFDIRWQVDHTCRTADAGWVDGPLPELLNPRSSRGDPAGALGLLAEQVGDDEAAWRLLRELAPTHDGTLAELVELVHRLTGDPAVS